MTPHVLINTFTLSGRPGERFLRGPEADRAEFFPMEAARLKINRLNSLLDELVKTSASRDYLYPTHFVWGRPKTKRDRGPNTTGLRFAAATIRLAAAALLPRICRSARTRIDRWRLARVLGTL